MDKDQFKEMAMNNKISHNEDYCITHPPLMWHGEFGFTYNLDAYCGCGKQYKDHDSWKKWMKEHGLCDTPPIQ